MSVPGRFEFTDHLCRICLGRVMMRVDKDPRVKKRIIADVREFRCANCGATGQQVVRSICCCGMKVPGMGRKDFRDAGIRCQPNPSICPEVPAEIIAKETA